MLRVRSVLAVGLFVLFGGVGWYGYTFFFDTTQPRLHIQGMEEGGYYSGDVSCTAAGSKSGEISVWLDGQPLVNKFKMGMRAHEHPFVIPTKTIANGKHLLKAEFIDNTYRQNKVSLERTFNVDNVPLQAAFVKSDAASKVFQGRTLHLQFQANKEIKEARVHLLENEFVCLPESKKSLVYECFIPIACEETPNEYLLSARLTDNVGNELSLENKFQVVMYPFKKQQLTISAEKIKLEEEIGKEANAFENLIETLSLNSPQQKLWKGAFCTPIDISRVSCEFGTVRTTQHKGRYAHKALDVLNAPKSVVWSSQDGTIALKERFAHSGNTVVVDHGLGVLSMYFHLDDFAKINVGDKIAKGNPLGTLGKTGYASGYHLHWEMRVNNVAVDPMQWTKVTF